MARTCFVHIGTHKTGTTSLQALLGLNEDLFEQYGLYIPKTCRIAPEFGSHHNLAWELNSDPRFNPSRGTFSELLAEIDSIRPPSACLSSEDFEYLHRKPGAIRFLRDGLAKLGYVCQIIVYLRPQADYSESLYAELVKHGLALPFPTFLGNILAHGSVTHRDIWTFTFDYSELLAPFTGVVGAHQLTVRNYPAQSDNRALLHDFLVTVASHATGLLPNLRYPERLNSSNDWADVIRRYCANALQVQDNYDLSHGAPPSPSESAGMPSRVQRLTLADLVQIQLRFRRPNRRVRSIFGISISAVSAERTLAAQIMDARLVE